MCKHKYNMRTKLKVWPKYRDKKFNFRDMLLRGYKFYTCMHYLLQMA